MVKTNSRRLFPVVGIWCLVVLFAPVRFAMAQVDYVWDFALSHARYALKDGEFKQALKHLKRANETLKDKCGEAWLKKKCVESLTLTAAAYIGLESYKKAVESSDQAILLAGDDKQLAWEAYNNKGLALQTWANKKDQKKLQAAEVAFRQALALEGAVPLLHFNLGVALLQTNRDPEGIAELQHYIKDDPDGALVEDAKKMAANPRRARENYAPDFSFTSSDGKQISLDDLAGKVVVLDFWGTWCGPCVESVPELRQLNQKYSQDPSFVLISISSDRDEEVWREFTQKYKMVWLQYRDRDRRILRAFEITAFPTYIIIDHEGIIRQRTVGLNWSGSAGLDGVIKKQLKLVAKTTASKQ
jgi:thiol-disulfide isomerase/thioredoxin